MKTTMLVSSLAGLFAVLAVGPALRGRRMVAPEDAPGARALLELQAGVLQVEDALTDGAPRAQVRDLVDRAGRGMEPLQRAALTVDGTRDLRELEDARRRWQELTVSQAEMERGPDEELAKRRLERRGVRERLLALINRAAATQHDEARMRQEALAARATNGLGLTAMLAALAGLLSFGAAALSRLQHAPVARQGPAGGLPTGGLPGGRAALEATTLTKAISPDQEVAVHIEIRPRR